MQTQSFLPVLENLKVARSIDADIPSQDQHAHTNALHHRQEFSITFSQQDGSLKPPSRLQCN